MIARRSLLIFANKLITLVLGYVALFFIARYMGPTALGMIGYALSFVGIFSFIADLGFDSAHIKKMNEEDQKKCIGTYTIIKTVLIMIFLGFALALTLFVKFTTGFESVEQEQIIYIILVYFFFTSYTSIFENTFIAKKEIVKREAPVLISCLIQSPVKITIAVLSMGVIMLAGVYLLGVVIIFIASLFLFRKYILVDFDRDIAKQYFMFAFPLMISSAITVIMLHVDNIMIEAFWHTKDVGYFFTMRRIGELLDIISVSVGTILFPVLVGYYASKNIENVKAYIQKAERYISFILIPILLSIILYAEEVVGFLFGAEFMPAANILRLISIFAFFSSINRVYVAQLLGAGKPGIVTGLNILNISLHLALNFILIPVSFFGMQLFGMGALGAALSLVVSIAFTSIVLRIISKKLTGIYITKNVILHVAAAFITGMGFYFLKINMLPITLPVLIALGILTTLVYLGILVLMKEFRKEDFRFFMDLLSAKKMKGYVTDELKG